MNSVALVRVWLCWHHLVTQRRKLTKWGKMVICSICFVKQNAHLHVTFLSKYRDIYFQIDNIACFASPLGHFAKWKHTYLNFVAYFQMTNSWEWRCAQRRVEQKSDYWFSSTKTAIYGANVYISRAASGWACWRFTSVNPRGCWELYSAAIG